MTAASTTRRARAKVNLLLRVVGRRDDGYHELFTLFDRISLADTLTVERAESCSIECDDPALAGDDNLALRAARLVCEHTQSPGFHLTLSKQIPIAAGLGGGSSDAAAALEACNALASTPLPGSRLHTLARELGADVPFFLGSRMAIGTGVGDVLIEVPDPPELHYVLLWPRFPVSTAEIFAAWTGSASANPIPTVENVLESLRLSGIGGVCDLMGNDLEPVVSALHPEIEAMKAALKDAGALQTSLSGSGGTVFGLFRRDAQARNAYDGLVRDGRWDVFLACGQ